MNGKTMTAFGTAALCATSLFAGTYTWTGGGDGTSWSDAANWGADSYPNASDATSVLNISGEDTTVALTEGIASKDVKTTTDGSGLTFDLGGQTLTLGSVTNLNVKYGMRIYGTAPHVAFTNGTLSSTGCIWMLTDGVDLTFSKVAATVGNGGIRQVTDARYQTGGRKNWSVRIENGSSFNGQTLLYGGGRQQVVVDNSTVSGDFAPGDNVNGGLYLVKNGGSASLGSGWWKFSGSGMTFHADGAGSSLKFNLPTGANYSHGIAVSKTTFMATDGATLTLPTGKDGFDTTVNNNDVNNRFIMTNGTIKVTGNGKSAWPFNFATHDTDASCEGDEMVFAGVSPRMAFPDGDCTLGSDAELASPLKLVFTPGAAGFAAAPLAVEKFGKILTIGANVKFCIDASAMATPMEGEPVTVPLATAAGTLSVADDVLNSATFKLPVFTLGALVQDGNALNLILTYNASKREIAAPAIASKTYTGETLTADVPASADYTVTQNEGGIEAGSYDVVLTLTDAVATKWVSTDDADLTLAFTITQTTNEWTTEPSMDKTEWIAGEEPGVVSVGAALHGTPTVTYGGAPEMPVAAGVHTALVAVVETASYAGVSKEIEFTIRKSDYIVNAWTKGPELSKYAWLSYDEPATVTAQALVGDVVVTYDEGLTEMPLTGGAHTVHFNVAETEDWSGLSSNLTYTITMVGPGYGDVEAVTYIWTNAVQTGTWDGFANWSSTLAADRCCGYPNSTTLSTAVFGPLDGVDSLTVTPGALDEVKMFNLDFRAGMPTNIVFDMQGKKFTTGEHAMSQSGTPHEWPNNTTYTFRNGTFGINLRGAGGYTFGVQFGTNSVVNLRDHATVNWGATRALGKSDHTINVTEGSQWISDGGFAYWKFSCWGSCLNVSGQGSLYREQGKGDYARYDSRVCASDGGTVTLYDYNPSLLDGSAFEADGLGSSVTLSSATYENTSTYENLRFEARNRGVIYFGGRHRVDRPTGIAGNNTGFRLTLDNGTLRTTYANGCTYFNVGTHTSDVEASLRHGSPTMTFKGAAPLCDVSTCDAKFGSDVTGLAETLKMNYEIPAGGWENAPVQCAKNVTIGSNVTFRVSCEGTKADVPLVKATGSLTVDVAALNANLVLPHLFSGELYVSEDGKTLRLRMAREGIIFFVK